MSHYFSKLARRTGITHMHSGDRGGKRLPQLARISNPVVDNKNTGIEVHTETVATVNHGDSRSIIEATDPAGKNSEAVPENIPPANQEGDVQQQVVDSRAGEAAVTAKYADSPETTGDAQASRQIPVTVTRQPDLTTGLVGDDIERSQDKDLHTDKQIHGEQEQIKTVNQSHLDSEQLAKTDEPSNVVTRVLHRMGTARSGHMPTHPTVEQPSNINRTLEKYVAPETNPKIPVDPNKNDLTSRAGRPPATNAVIDKRIQVLETRGKSEQALFQTSSAGTNTGQRHRHDQNGSKVEIRIGTITVDVHQSIPRQPQPAILQPKQTTAIADKRTQQSSRLHRFYLRYW